MCRHSAKYLLFFLITLGHLNVIIINSGKMCVVKRGPSNILESIKNTDLLGSTVKLITMPLN